ncbi:MAG: excinuclease ABC subunit C, partial [Firmicutes bacterium]|nr:excinuclease ABC subunit C [Bacillota bacterium]
YIFENCQKKPVLIVPQKGAKADILKIAQKNADDYLLKSRSKEEVKNSMTIDAVTQLEKILGIKSARRMECYDISNISGTDKVASQVVFIDGEPAKKEYRKYKIKTVEGSNDFASMIETLQRRLQRAKDGDKKFVDLPDLIVIDGGKGQLSSAIEALDGAGFSHIDIVSLAKREEEIFVRGRLDPIVIPHTHNALKLMQRLRDEAHRFAITFHRQVRAKNFLPKEKTKQKIKKEQTKQQGA